MNKHAVVKTVLGVVGLVTAAFMPQSTAFAQNRPLSPNLAMAADSLAARITIQAIVEKLAGSIISAQSRSDLEPWVVEFPRANGVPWKDHEEIVLRIIKGRRPEKSDSAMMSVHIAELRMHGDTLVARFEIGGRSKCRGEWRGGASGYEMRAVKHFDWYGRVEIKSASESDSIPCQIGN